MKTPIDRILDDVDWKENVPPDHQSDIPWATHSGVLIIGDIWIRVHQLSNGTRVIDAEDLERLFGAV